MQALARVACVQAAPVFLDLIATVDKTLALIEAAARQGAQLIAFPEAWIPGYPWFLWLDAPTACAPLIQLYRENSLRLGSKQALRISDAARQHAIHVVLGYSERDNESLYIGQWLIDDQGRTLGNRRKIKIPQVERIVFQEGERSEPTYVNSRLGTLQAKCCMEQWQVTDSDTEFSVREQIHIVAWPGFSLYRRGTIALGQRINMVVSRLYAREGQCFVLAPCALVSPAMLEQLCSTNYQRTLLKAGGGYARIFAPDGTELAAPLGEDEEGILYATLMREPSIQHTAYVSAQQSATPKIHTGDPGAG
jgi:nitrilase